MNGLGTKVDMDKSRGFLDKACATIPAACFELGQSYAGGEPGRLKAVLRGCDRDNPDAESCKLAGDELLPTDEPGAVKRWITACQLDPEICVDVFYTLRDVPLADPKLGLPIVQAACKTDPLACADETELTHRDEATALRTYVTRCKAGETGPCDAAFDALQTTKLDAKTRLEIDAELCEASGRGCLLAAGASRGVDDTRAAKLYAASCEHEDCNQVVSALQLKPFPPKQQREFFASLCEKHFMGCGEAAESFLSPTGGPVDPKRAAALVAIGCSQLTQCSDAVRISNMLPDELGDPLRELACQKFSLEGCMAQPFVKKGDLLYARDPAHVSAFLARVCVDANDCPRVLEFLNQTPPADAKVELDVYAAACKHQPNGEACVRAATLLRGGLAGAPDPARAATLLEALCADEQIASCVQLAAMLQDGELPADPKRAAAILAKACGDDVKSSADPWDEACPAHAALLDKTDPEAATAELRRACGVGRPESCIRLAARLGSNPARVFAITARACQDGSPVACAQVFEDIANNAVAQGGIDHAVEFILARCQGGMNPISCGVTALLHHPQRSKIMAGLANLCSSEAVSGPAACDLGDALTAGTSVNRCLGGQLAGCRENDDVDLACRADRTMCAQAASDAVNRTHRLEALQWDHLGCVLGDDAGCKRLGGKR
jgi:TPR repeat protein